MRFTHNVDNEGRLTCELSLGGSVATLAAHDGRRALLDLRTAVEKLTYSAQSEVWWAESTGNYRWVFRRVDAAVRIAVMWSTGTVTGWEHVFWAECPLIDLLQAVLSAEGPDELA